MPPPKLSEKVTLYDLFPNVDFNFIPNHSALDEPTLPNSDDYDEHSPEPVFDVALSIPYCIQHTGVLYFTPNPTAFIEPVFFNINNNFSFSLAPNIPPEAPAAQHAQHNNGCTNGEPRLNICSTTEHRSESRAAEAGVVALSWNTSNNDIYWIWVGLGFTLNHLLVKLCAYYLNITQKIKTYTDARNPWDAESSDCTGGGEVNNTLQALHQPRGPATQATPFPGPHVAVPREGTTANIDHQREPLTIATAILEHQEAMPHGLDKMCEKY
ncbi:hypothetical protein F5144DRAFT_585633 [Chaetomium tenue]|uniref:Uncharacterized protein n=1 Tax=Chaetomium tenue TaxID=1854479 RepID=A0ACB7NUS5_9PEZI|nr:hypothetical protein F5144DRAFT_585633 [Chaetomium globosum]